MGRWAQVGLPQMSSGPQPQLLGRPLVSLGENVRVRLLFMQESCTVPAKRGRVPSEASAGARGVTGGRIFAEGGRRTGRHTTGSGLKNHLLLDLGGARVSLPARSRDTRGLGSKHTSCSKNWAAVMSRGLAAATIARVGDWLEIRECV